MGLFRKKADPLAQRAQSLNRRIAELEAEIARLNHNLEPPPAQPPRPGNTSRPTSPKPKPAAPPTHEPVFEEIPARPIAPSRTPPAPGRESVELGLKRPIWSEWWRRLKRQFVDPPPTNEKLVNYLAAGSIQGLRSLRYERRIARNRIIFVCVVLGLLLWGVLAVVWHSR
ncbi:MAG: hypothetical protein AB7J34_15695 [Limisphaerales bacterium]